MAIFEEKALQECSDSLSRYHPSGKLFLAKSIQDKNYEKFINGLSEEVCRAQDSLVSFITEILPDQTSLLIDEWESALGIPDSCFSKDGPDSERRRNVLIKLGSSGLQTAEDFVEFAALFNTAITVDQPGPFTIEITFTDAQAEEFPLTFPIPFGNNVIAVIECLFTKLKPANCNIIFIEL